MRMPRTNLLCLCVAVATLALVTVSTARAEKQLRWKFKEGETLNYAMSQKRAILIDANGIEIDIKMNDIMDLTWTVKSVAADGTAELSQKVDRMQLKMNTPFTGEFVYDSKEAKEPESEIWQRMGTPIKAMLDGEFLMKVSPAGKVEDIKLPEKLSAALAEQRGGGGGQMMMMGGGMFSENTIKQMLEQAVLLLPDKGVSDGVTWSKQLENKMGPLGTQKMEVTYSYAGTEPQDGKVLDKIETKTELSFVPNEDNDSDIEMEVTEQEGSGTILFDANAGRTIQSSNVQKMTMEGDFMGNEFAQEITLSVLLKVGTSADLPKDEEEPAADAKDDADKDKDKADADKKDADKDK